MNAIKLLVQADQQLETISVRGSDAFAMVNARKLLSAVYNELRKEAERDDSSVDSSGDSAE